MEDSTNHSSINNALVPSKATLTDFPEEESGWTAYLEDLFTQSTREDSISSGSDTSSMVSDAASFPSWKLSHNNRVAACYPNGVLPNAPKNLIFKKTRAEEICHDNSLEDTASSSVKSHKVRDLRPIDRNHVRKTNDHFNNSLGKGVTVDHYGGLMERDERCEVSFNGKNQYADLKKRGKGMREI